MKTIFAIFFALSLVCRAETLMDRDNKPWSNGSRDWESFAKSRELVAKDAGHSTWRLGAGPCRPITFKRWWALGHRGMFYTGTGYTKHFTGGFHSMELAIEGGHHPGYCWVGWSTPDVWKRGGFGSYRVTHW